MNFEERSYSGSVMRPRPQRVDVGLPHIFALATAWGRGSAKENAVDFFKESLRDSDSTLAEFGDAFRDLNLHIYNEINTNDFQFSLELLVIQYRNGILSWVLSGSVNLYLKQQGVLVPIDVRTEVSGLLGQTAPLPHEGMGLVPDLKVRSGQLILNSPPEIFLVARSVIVQVPLVPEARLKDWVSLFSQEASDLPFWLGHLQY